MVDSVNAIYLFFNLLDPNVLEHWLKVMKVGGMLCIVHKASVCPKWEADQDNLVATKVWESVWITEQPVSIIMSQAAEYIQ